jgi:uncharacterized Zn-finger protein
VSTIEQETIYVADRSVACDGGGGPLGHPKVWLAIPSSGRADCGYCGRVFIYRKDAPAGDQIDEQAPPGVTADDRAAGVDPEPQG